MRNKWST